ncbi:hypothetical protein L7F22_031637 [Adiantum nelumboides]|nr:hypothetical protein [Adiantum nelumboides]
MDLERLHREVGDAVADRLRSLSLDGSSNSELDMDQVARQLHQTLLASPGLSISPSSRNNPNPNSTSNSFSSSTPSKLSASFRERSAMRGMEDDDEEDEDMAGGKDDWLNDGDGKPLPAANMNADGELVVAGDDGQQLNYKQGVISLDQARRSASSSSPSRSSEQTVAKLCHRQRSGPSQARVRSLWNEFKVLRGVASSVRTEKRKRNGRNGEGDESYDASSLSRKANGNGNGIGRGEEQDWHPNIVRFQEFIISPSYACLFMPYYPQPMNVALPEHIYRDYFQGLASGLFWLHSHNCTHNDIKTANILVSPSSGTEYGVPILVDFGFAVLHSGNVSGTANFGAGGGSQASSKCTASTNEDGSKKDVDPRNLKPFFSNTSWGTPDCQPIKKRRQTNRYDESPNSTRKRTARGVRDAVRSAERRAVSPPTSQARVRGSLETQSSQREESGSEPVSIPERNQMEDSLTFDSDDDGESSDEGDSTVENEEDDNPTARQTTQVQTDDSELQPVYLHPPRQTSDDQIRSTQPRRMSSQFGITNPSFNVKRKEVDSSLAASLEESQADLK